MISRQCSLSIAPENIRKPLVSWCFQGLLKRGIGLRWVKLYVELSISVHVHIYPYLFNEVYVKSCGIWANSPYFILIYLLNLFSYFCYIFRYENSSLFWWYMSISCLSVSIFYGNIVNVNNKNNTTICKSRCHRYGVFDTPF